MGTIIGVIAVFALIPMVIAGMFFIGYARSHEAEGAIKSGVVFFGVLALIIAAPKGDKFTSSNNCSMEWDMRASRSDCD